MDAPYRGLGSPTNVGVGGPSLNERPKSQRDADRSQHQADRRVVPGSFSLIFQGISMHFSRSRLS